MKIVAFHLLNDYSGSPKVLMQLAKGWTREGLKVKIVSSFNKRGFLTDIPGAEPINIDYNFYENKFLRLMMLLFWQIKLIYRLFFLLKKEDVVYINTILPFGAAIVGQLKGCRIIYHIHETSIKPYYFKQFLLFFVRAMADDVIFVSAYLCNEEKIPKLKNHVLYNAIEDEFVEAALNSKFVKSEVPEVLMVCSLKAYKGVFEFYEIAKLLPKYNFSLVLNTDEQEIINVFGIDIPTNLKIFPVQTDVAPFYAKAHIILNLSRPDEWIETFGLTIIEGMSYGLPAIVPPVGGISELVDEGQNGYHISAYETDRIAEKIEHIFSNKVLMDKLSKQALFKLKQYKEAPFISQSIEIIKRTNNGL